MTDAFSDSMKESNVIKEFDEKEKIETNKRHWVKSASIIRGKLDYYYKNSELRNTNFKIDIYSRGDSQMILCFRLILPEPFNILCKGAWNPFRQYENQVRDLLIRISDFENNREELYKLVSGTADELIKILSLLEKIFFIIKEDAMKLKNEISTACDKFRAEWNSAIQKYGKKN